jgi:DNA topoisomerase I
LTEQTITLDDALKLLALPREIGAHPDDGQPIVTNFGRFGPYVKHNDEFRSLESDGDVFTIPLDEALALLRAPKQSRRRQAARQRVLKELTNNGTTIKLLSGRYGPYVTDGTTNASVPKGLNPESVTFERAVELLEARRNMVPSPRRAGGGSRRRAAASTSRPHKTARKAAGA